jgi:phosphatidylserine/phosphatidylglycerophosphate/cardiolipin synthase-like enzyme
MNIKNWFQSIGTHSRVFCLVLFISGCATLDQQASCPAGQVGSACIPADAIEDASVSHSYESRTWVKPSELEIDPIKLGMEAKIPILGAQVKFLGPSQEDGLRSLAAKIWMIDHAEHTIDAAYYIFSRDLVGRAMIGALCNAVERGVDVRLMVDSVGSWHHTHPYLKTLINCSDKAGFMRNADGQVTNKRARAQVIIFNALSKVFVKMNRRSHDKMLVIDGHYPDRAIVLTGGRNVSLDYYGLKEDGSVDPSAFKDLEMLLKPAVDRDIEEYSVGSISELYMSVIYLNKGNKFLKSSKPFETETKKSQQALGILRGFDNFDHYYREMDSYMTEGFFEANVRLAHELGNLQSKDVVEKRAENLDANPNSISGLLDRIVAEVGSLKRIRIVSPYLFMAEYTTSSGEVYYDGKDALDVWLAADSERTIEIITNSVLTSDNFMAQSIIDIDMVPRVLLAQEQREAWKTGTWEVETNPEVVESEQWKRLIANPRIKIYQLGKLDSEILGGRKYYGKLHAKFVLADEIGFVGTTNLDYRSRLYNNEMGFFFRGDELRGELNAIFEDLKKDSYLWGTPEWLEMREKLRRAGGTKGKNTYKQRKTYKWLEESGLKWQI